MFYIKGLVYIGDLYSNGQSMGYVLCTRLTIQIPDGVHLSGIQMVRLSGIQMALKKTRPFGIQPLFDHLNTVPD